MEEVGVCEVCAVEGAWLSLRLLFLNLSAVCCISCSSLNVVCNALILFLAVSSLPRLEFLLVDSPSASFISSRLAIHPGMLEVISVVHTSRCISTCVCLSFRLQKAAMRATCLLDSFLMRCGIILSRVCISARRLGGSDTPWFLALDVPVWSLARAVAGYRNW